MIVYLHTGHTGPYDAGWVVVVHKVLDALCRVAIPWFFFAAGFFLARHIGEEGWWKREVRKRIGTLLIPFWFWGVVIWIVYVGIAFLIKRTGVAYNGVDSMEWFSVLGIMRVAGLDPFGNMPTMWFMRTLFLFVCMAPLIARFKKEFAILSFVAYVTFTVLSYKMGDQSVYVLEYLISLRGLLYFSFGIILSMLDENGIVSSRVRALLIYSGICFLGGNILLPQCPVFDVLMVPGLMLGLFELCRHITLPSRLSSISFPIYVMHSIVAFPLSGIYSLVFGNHKTDFVLCVLKFAITLIVVVELAWLLKLLFPKLAKLIYGGR